MLLSVFDNPPLDSYHQRLNHRRYIFSLHLCMKDLFPEHTLKTTLTTKRKKKKSKTLIVELYQLSTQGLDSSNFFFCEMFSCGVDCQREMISKKTCKLP